MDTEADEGFTDAKKKGSPKRDKDVGFISLANNLAIHNASRFQLLQQIDTAS